MIRGCGGVDQLTFDLDFAQIDDIEQRRNGGDLIFTFTMGGLAFHGGRISALQPANHLLTYDVVASGWTTVLQRIGYGRFLTIEVPYPSSVGLTGDAQLAAEALDDALAAIYRGDYAEAVADCRPGIEALRRARRGEFQLKPWAQDASRDERLDWLQHSLLALAHLAHHPNDAANASTDTQSSDWSRNEAQCVVVILAALIRYRHSTT